MDKYDYITATIEEEKIRLEKLISYLKETNSDSLPEEQERYNNILKYLNAKEKYYNIEKNIKINEEKLNEFGKIKDEYEVDNILLEDTLLSKFHEDTNNVYRNLLYEDIKKQDESIKDILYLIFEKNSNYTELIIKRNRLKEKLNREKFPKTYDQLLSQEILIEKQNNIQDEVFLIENNIKTAREKQKNIENLVMTEPILKILYEFWIIDSYDPNKVNKNKLFKDNRTLVSIKNTVLDVEEEPVKNEEKIIKNNNFIANLNLPGVHENTQIDIDGKNYVKNDK